MGITDTEEIDEDDDIEGEPAEKAGGRCSKISGCAAGTGETVEEEPGTAYLGKALEEIPETAESGETMEEEPGTGSMGETMEISEGKLQNMVPTRNFHMKRMFEWLLPYLLAAFLVIGVGGVVLIASSLRTQRLYDLLQEQYGEYIADE